MGTDVWDYSAYARRAQASEHPALGREVVGSSPTIYTSHEGIMDMETLEAAPMDLLTILLATADVPLDDIGPEVKELFVTPMLDDTGVPVARFGSAI
jgi:hypothetical protein